MKKILLVLLIFPFVGILQAQEISVFTFNHLALSVKNLDDSVAFYKDVLGLPEITNKSKIEGIRWFSFGEGKELHLISIIKEPVTVNKAVHLALTTPKFDDFITKLVKLKITYEDFQGNLNKVTIRADGIKQIYFQDPNGYWIEVNSVGK